nr:hypothetical protein [Tanacetum cinerariifolium]
KFDRGSRGGDTASVDRDLVSCSLLHVHLSLLPRILLLPSGVRSHSACYYDLPSIDTTNECSAARLGSACDAKAPLASLLASSSSHTGLPGTKPGLT